jgi:hypothetical protein
LRPTHGARLPRALSRVGKKAPGQPWQMLSASSLPDDFGGGRQLSVEASVLATSPLPLRRLPRTLTRRSAGRFLIPRSRREVRPRLRPRPPQRRDHSNPYARPGTNANAHAERWVGSARRERLDRLLLFSRRQLEHVLRIDTRHLQPRSAASGARTPEHADGNPAPLRAPPYPATTPQRPARRLDPRVRTRSLRPRSISLQH